MDVTIVVPAVLGGLAITVMALVSLGASRKSRRHRLGPAGMAQVRVLIHSINDDRCTGCDACVAVCPTNVLDLMDNKSRVLRFEDCIQCEACMWACPTTALVMHPEGTEPPSYRVPDLDNHYQTAVPGQYLIGEVAGKPLVKNAANLGRAVIEHMLAGGLAPGRGGQGTYDVAIVGSGPGGLSAALSCIQRGLSYVLLEKDSLVASTIARYPKGKLIMAEPYQAENLSLLPIFDSSKEEIVPLWKQLIKKVGLKIRMNEAVERVGRGHDGVFDVHTNVSEYRAQRVVLATGLRGKPRTLGVVGENQAKVQALLEDPDLHRGQTVCVIGGGDSALEAAIALADAGAKVILSYRGRSFSRAQPKNRQTVESYEAQRRIKVKYQSDVAEFGPDTVTLRTADGTHKRYPNQAAFVLIGADPPVKWLATLGIHYVERPHMSPLPQSDGFVRQLVPDAQPCPESVEGAAAVLRGEHVPVPSVGDSTGLISEAPRKWLRSASQLITGHGAKLHGPMPLSEFAKQARRHSGHGRRDQLDARERTRVLRMLRDEGGLRADEDSKMINLDQVERNASRSRSRSSAPPRVLPPDMATMHEAHIGSAGRPANADDPLATIPPNSGVRPIRGDSPKAAVIVGLERAKSAPRRRSRESERPPIVEEATRRVSASESRKLLDDLDIPTQREEALDHGYAAEQTPSPDAPTAMFSIDERGKTVDKHGPRVQQDSETRQVDMSKLDIPGYKTARDQNVPAKPPSDVRGLDDPTRAVSLSEVDWDID